MPAKLVYFRPTKIAFVRTDGQSESAIADAWNTINTLILDPSFGDAVDRAFGLHWNKPCDARGTTDYEAGIVYTASVDVGRTSQFSTRTLPGGSYVRQTINVDPKSRLQDIAGALGRWTDNRNFQIDEQRPTIEVLKLRTASDLDSASFELCVPVVPRLDVLAAA